MVESESEVAGRIVKISQRFASHKACPGKDTLVKLLKEAVDALEQLEQSESLKSMLTPLSRSLVRFALLKHKDRDVRLLVGICFCEIIRVLAPNPDFSDATFRDIFRLLLSIFAELDDTKHAFLDKRVQLLETVAKLRFCVIMLDIGCEDLVLKMFKIFFSIVRDHHPLSMIDAMSSIMTDVLEEKVVENSSELLSSEGKVSEPLLDVILQNLLKETKDISASKRLAIYIIQNYGGKLEHIIARFLRSCILNRDAVGSMVKEYYHEIIYEIFHCAPQMLISVIPTLTNELLTDQVDVRIKALNLIGKLLSLPGNHVAKDYRYLFMEFLNRFSDKSAEVRLNALSHAKTLYIANELETEITESSQSSKTEVLSALEGRLLDLDDGVRAKAVTVLCDLARNNFKSFPSKLISLIADRLRDKKVSVRTKALKKLLEVYQEYCTKCAPHVLDLSDSLEQIPCKILMLCYGKDCEEFKPERVEHLLAEDLFPASLSTKEITKHWVFIFSLFTPPHLKVLNIILSQKRRLQKEIQDYLALQNKDDDQCLEDIEMKIKISIVKMSALFTDPAKAEECFHKLDKVKDKGIFDALEKVLTQVAGGNAQVIRDNLLTVIGDSSPHFEFLQLLFKKCSFNIFNSQHVHYMLERLSLDRFEHLEHSCVQLLLTIVNAFPSLLRGLEIHFRRLLLEGVIPINDLLLQMLANGTCIGIKLSDIYSSLERICLEGSRTQSKLACSAIAALLGPSDQFLFPDLCKKLVDSLRMGQQIQTVLQSLGCLAQHSVVAFEAHEQEVTHFITKEIFQSKDAGSSEDQALLENSSNCSSYCKLKIFGLQMLVRSFLPHKHTHISRPISFLLDIILHMLQKGAFPQSMISSDSDSAHYRLAAAKSVLRLSRRWDLHISPEIFRLTVLMAKDNSPFIREHFVNKVQKLLRVHKIPCRYACALSFAASDSPEHLSDISMKNLEEFIKDYSDTARVHQTSVMPRKVTDSPVYTVIFLIHVLAHDTSFPPFESQDEEVYAQFFRPLILTLKALVDVNCLDRDMDSITHDVSYLRNLFHAIKKAEDAIDDHMTHKLHILADIGISFLNSLANSSSSSTHTPGLILLPSSLYKISSGYKCQGGGNSLKYCQLDKSFTNKFLQHIISSSWTARNIGKSYSKSQADSLRTHATKRLKSESAFCKKGYIPLTTTREQCHNPHSDQKEPNETLPHLTGRGKENEPMLSISAPVERGEQRNSGEVIRNELLPSTNHVMVGSMFSQKGEHLFSLKEIGTVTRCNSTAEQIKSSKRTTSNDHVSQDIQNQGETLIGHHTELSSVDRRSCSGLVEGFDSCNSADKDFDARQSSDNREGAFCQENASVDKSKFQGRKIPLTASLKKREQLLVDSSSSEVIGGNKDALKRRTRRRKV
ncbi:PREDICTED: sister chromatid cohesion protein pds5 isoform X2 [Ipomoea nil]|uniref:sister chromatid cohesion protein pds5 isoform X2 n=1 Tax=Ipomoea nil TaxID=35883 RepID=UPI0009015AFC|nr:PREDICTED: sister chromatid cohesion protein pds5 isoform X2 [Ipomoea nil]